MVSLKEIYRPRAVKKFPVPPLAPSQAFVHVGLVVNGEKIRYKNIWITIVCLPCPGGNPASEFPVYSMQSFSQDSSRSESPSLGSRNRLLSS